MVSFDLCCLSVELRTDLDLIVNTFGNRLNKFRFPPNIARELQKYVDYASAFKQLASTLYTIDVLESIMFMCATSLGDHFYHRFGFLSSNITAHWMIYISVMMCTYDYASAAGLTSLLAWILPWKWCEGLGRYWGHLHWWIWQDERWGSRIVGSFTFDLDHNWSYNRSDCGESSRQVIVRERNA
jgi:hypothetical protein